MFHGPDTSESLV